LKVFFIGNGNVAQHLANAITIAGHDVIGHYARSKKDIPQLSKYYSHYDTISGQADIYLICVSDDAIKTVCEHLPSTIKEEKIVAHTSGAKSLDETLEQVARKGVFYPLQTFTAGREMDYKEIPFCIHGKNDQTIETLTELAATISKTVVLLDDEQRKQVHLSAVLINNFVNHLIDRSEQLLESNDIDPTILQPLLIETINKQADIGSHEAQTGPARRGDDKTIQAHLEMLTRKSDKKLYKAISKSITKNYKK